MRRRLLNREDGDNEGYLARAVGHRSCWEGERAGKTDKIQAWIGAGAGAPNCTFRAQRTIPP